MTYGVHRRGRGRSPVLPGSGGNASQLAFATAAPGGVQNGTTWGGPVSVQIQDNAGHPIALAGVEVLLALAAGSVAGTFTATRANPGPSGGQFTDATGLATFTSPKFTGMVGSIQLVASAAGFTPITSSGIVVVTGTAVASQSTATVPAGTTGSTTTLSVQARDISGNALTIGGSTVIVTITGANTAGPDPATDLGNGVYQYAYIPLVVGTDTVAITLDGSAISGSPYSSTVTAPVSVSTILRVGLFNFGTTEWGNGPGDDTATPRWNATVTVPTPSTISSLIDLADATDMLVFINFADSRNFWCDVSGSFLIYNPTKYANQVQRFNSTNLGATLYAKVVNALLRRRLIAYCVDEPKHPIFNGSISNSQINDMGLLHKSVFGNANTITSVRTDASFLTPAPSGGYTGLDYGWAQSEGPLHQPSNGVTATQWFVNAYNGLAALNMGMIGGHNWLDGGDATCWDYLNTGSSSGLIAGTFTQGGIVSPTQSVSCALGTQGNSRWYTSPTRLRGIMDALAALPNYADVPALMFWSHSPRGADTQDPTFGPLEDRSDVIAAMDYVLTTGNARASSTGWRTPK